MPLEGRSPARWPFVLLRSLVVVKGPTGSGVRLLAFFGGRRGAELGEGNQVRECGAWDGRQPRRGGLDFPWFGDRAGGPWWNVARAFLPGGFFKSSSSQVKSRRGVAMRKTA
jgi:hypothetical protein